MKVYQGYVYYQVLTLELAQFSATIAITFHSQMKIEPFLLTAVCKLA